MFEETSRWVREGGNLYPSAKAKPFEEEEEEEDGK